MSKPARIQWTRTGQGNEVVRDLPCGGYLAVCSYTGPGGWMLGGTIYGVNIRKESLATKREAKRIADAMAWQLSRPVFR